MKYVWFMLCVACLVLLSGCDSQEIASDADAQALATNYLNAVHNGEYEKAFQYCSDDFFNVRSKDGWQRLHRSVETKLGKIVRMDMKHKVADDRLTARFYMYQFNSKYENGLAKETVTMLQKFNSDEPFLIYAHKIESSKLSGIENLQ